MLGEKAAAEAVILEPSLVCTISFSYISMHRSHVTQQSEARCRSGFFCQCIFCFLTCKLLKATKAYG